MVKGGGAKGMISKLFRSSSQSTLEEQLVAAHREASERAPERLHLQQRYLQLCRSMSFYGSVNVLLITMLMTLCDVICS